MTGRIERLALAGWRGIRYLEFELDKGPFTGFMGSPGAGKSTVGMLVCNALLPDRRFLEIRPLSTVQDVHQAGVDTLAGRIDPAGGYAYVLIDMRVGHTRLVAGIHAAMADGKAEFTPLAIQGAPMDWPLQDFLRVLDGEEEYYPDLGELTTQLARHGVSLKVCKTVREYGELLHAAGVVPCDYSGGSERRLYGQLLESTFRGGISQEVASQIKSYMLPEATRVPDSVSRLQQCADVVLRTKNALAEAERQLALLEATYGLGKAIVARAVRQCHAGRDEYARMIDQQEAACGDAQANIKAAGVELEQLTPLIEIAEKSKDLLEEEFAAQLREHEQVQAQLREKKVHSSAALQKAKTSLADFKDGRNRWTKLTEGLRGVVTLDAARAAMQTSGDKLLRDQASHELQLETDAKALADLEAGFGQSAAGALADALGATSLAEALDDVQPEEALALEISLGGLVEGVTGVDLDELARLKDDAAYPDTFWLRTTLPTAEPVHRVGDWFAAGAPGGFIVTSKRRRLALGRHARELQIERLQTACKNHRKSIENAGRDREAVLQRLQDLATHASVIGAYLDRRDDEVRLAEALNVADTEDRRLDQLLNEAIAALGKVNNSRAERAKKLEQDLNGLLGRRLAAQNRQADNEKSLKFAQTKLSDAQLKLEAERSVISQVEANLGASARWLGDEASALAPMNHDDYLTVQTKALAELAYALSEEEASTISWLSDARATDVVSCASIWLPLRGIVIDRVSSEALEDDSANLIATMRDRRRNLDSQLASDRAQMRAEAKSLYSVISTEIRKQSSRVKKLSALGETLAFGNVKGMRITMDVRQDWLDHLQRAANQIDLFTEGNGNSPEQPLDQKLAALFEKGLGVKLDGMALLDYRTYVDLTIEAHRADGWKPASGLSGAESIGGGLAVSLMLMRSLAYRAGDGVVRPFTPIFVVDEAQRMNADGQKLLVEFGRRQGFQVMVTALHIEAKFPCMLHVMERITTPQEQVVSRAVRVELPEVGPN